MHHHHDSFLFKDLSLPGDVYQQLLASVWYLLYALSTHALSDPNKAMIVDSLMAEDALKVGSENGEPLEAWKSLVLALIRNLRYPKWIIL